MRSPLRQFAYRQRWLYDAVTAVSSLSVGGVRRLRSLGLEALATRMQPGATVLDLCCGSGEAAAPWLARGDAVTGLDVSPQALNLAAARHPTLQRVEGLAEDPPLNEAQFDAIQISLALHEFTRLEREKVLQRALTLLRPGGWLVIIDLHPAGPWLRWPQQLFCALFETETALALLQDDLPAQLGHLGFAAVEQERLAGDALQRIVAQRPAAAMLSTATSPRP
jgi:ubiquinone/menaquinone biosynthesis C-methylase UbiE